MVKLEGCNSGWPVIVMAHQPLCMSGSKSPFEHTGEGFCAMRTAAHSVVIDRGETSRGPGGARFCEGPDIRRTLTVILALILLAAQSPLAAQNAGVFKLAGVSVTGSKRYDATEIARATGLKIAESLTVDSLKEAASKLASLGVFAQVNYRFETRGNTMTVVFTVEDAARFCPAPSEILYGSPHRNCGKGCVPACRCLTGMLPLAERCWTSFPLPSSPCSRREASTRKLNSHPRDRWVGPFRVCSSRW